MLHPTTSPHPSPRPTVPPAARDAAHSDTAHLPLAEECLSLDSAVGTGPERLEALLDWLENRA